MGASCFCRASYSGVLDGWEWEVQVRPAESAWKGSGVDRARTVAHQEMLTCALPGACRMSDVRSWTAEAVARVGVEDALEGIREMRSITWVMHISGKYNSNIRHLVYKKQILII